MANFFTRPDLDNRQFRQLVDSELTLSGETNFEGVLKSKNIEIDGTVASVTGDTGKVLTFNGTKIVLEPSTGGGQEYTGATPSNITVGGMPSGTDLSNRSLSDILEEILITYLAPAFTSFNVSSYSATVEVGTTISGSRTFTWSTSNSGNVQANSIVIRDLTSALDLGSGLANDGSELLAINTIQLNSDGANQQWRAQGTNTQSSGFNSSTRTTTARFLRFYGPETTSPTNSAEVRALPVSEFQTSNSQTFELNTGDVLTKYVVALPPSRTISSVFDLDALNVNITANYVLQGTINVIDAGGTNRSYNLYEMNNAVPYTSNHRHQITTG